MKMGSAAIIHIPSFINFGSGIPTLIGMIDRYTDTQEDGFMTLFLFF
jgi:hypothetical protein